MPTHHGLIDQANRKAATKSFQANHWGSRHALAWNDPREEAEAAIVGLIRAAASYADQHRARYDSKIGDDGVLGDHWRDIIQSIMGLLNGECGRLDCGTLDRLLRDMLEAEGFDRDA